jgi:hypothetical protein
MEVKFNEISQNAAEIFADELPDAATTKVIRYSGAVVKAAVKIGWLKEPQIADPEAVGKLPPGTVRGLAEAIAKEYARIMEISPS